MGNAQLCAKGFDVQQRFSRDGLLGGKVLGRSRQLLDLLVRHVRCLANVRHGGVELDGGLSSVCADSDQRDGDALREHLSDLLGLNASVVNLAAELCPRTALLHQISSGGLRASRRQRG